MNDFLKQFLTESREFVEQAVEGLLALERTPDDAELLDAVFRAVHTLKGGAGIMEFAAMERAVHAAENVLSDARSGRQPLTGPRIGNCLSCLDQIVQWLDLIEETGDLPQNAEPAADIVVRRFEAAAAKPLATATRNDLVDPSWSTDLLRRHRSLAASATAAVRFIPDPDCFYRGEDPIARMTTLPGLLAMELEPVGAFPPLNTLDPYQCNLVLTTLTAASVQELNAHMKGCAGEFEVVAIESTQTDQRDSSLSGAARDVLTAQIALLRDTDSQNFIGRVASAGLTAANVLRFSGRPDGAELIARHTEQSLAENAAQPLQDAIGRVLSGASAGTHAAAPSVRAASGNRTIRIDADRIDALVRLTSELTVAKNAVGHLFKLARAQGNSLAGALKDRHGVLEHLIGELQTSVLKMRVLPLRSVLKRFPRLVREMSLTLDKPLTLNVEGDDTEADKAIVEMLFEPLLHIVRNALDHGVEGTELRRSRGKPAVAVLQIRAARQGDQVLIEVQDDGGGVDVERVRQVALARGVVSEERLREMSEANIIELIFAPGFSTATQISEISGRGVGMDAVRTAVERVGGRVSIDSRAGLGTTVRIFLPFSVMMTSVMTVHTGDQIFGIPLDAIVETVRVPKNSIAGLGAAHAIVVRDRTVPVLELSGALGMERANPSEAEATIVITTAAGQYVGIQVDRLGEQMSVILLPLDGLLSGTPGIAGTTLLGDGRVLLVLDIGAMLQ
jgi:two-component system, chemotaxis family, sensor kinase CheA